MRFVPGLGAAMVVLGACGGTTANVDGGVDGSVSDSGSKDASTVDAAE